MMDDSSEHDTTRLALRAQHAREQLMTSLSRLDERAKHLVQRATGASMVSGLGLAASLTLWMSLSLLRPPPPALPPGYTAVRPRRSLASTLVRVACAAAGLAATAALLRSIERRAVKDGVIPRSPAGHSLH